MPSTALLALPYPASTDPGDVPGVLQSLATAVETIFANQGLRSARPSTALQGRRYYATDEGQDYRGDGTSWQTPGVSKAGGSTILASALGVIPLVLKLASGQTANALEVRSNAGALLASISATGQMFAPDGSAVLSTTAGNAAYLGLTAQAADSAKLGGVAAAGWAQRGQGAIASRAAAAIAGRLFLATDQDRAYLDDGATWHELLTASAGAALGNAAYVALAGNSTITATGPGIIPLVLRVASSQTANALEVRASDGTTLMTVIDATGRVYSGPGAAGFGAAAQLAVVSSGASTRPLLLRMATSAATNSFEIQKSDGTVLDQFFSDGSLGVGTHRLIVSSASAAANGYSAGIISQATVQPVLVVRGAAAQAGNLIEVQNSTGTPLAYLSPAGDVQASSVTAPNIRASSNFQFMTRLTTARAGGAAAALPANPVGYFQVADQDGNLRYLPYYS